MLLLKYASVSLASWRKLGGYLCHTVLRIGSLFDVLLLLLFSSARISHCYTLPVFMGTCWGEPE